MEYIIGIIVVLLIALFAASYLKAPPDMAYIISGIKRGKKEGERNARVVVGRATLRVPFLERVDKLRLSLMQVDIKTDSAVPTAEYINIFIDGVANIKVRSDAQSILRAAENFLGRRQAEIAAVAQQVLEGNMREIVGQMRLADLVQNRDLFAQKVLENAAEDMSRMGLEIVNLTIQNFVDKNGVIEDLGVDNVARIRKDAAIAKANAEKDIAVAEAAAREESNKARAEADIKIAEQNKVVEVKRSEYKLEQDTRRAEADAAYSIQEQEQRRSIETASVNADIARREREVELREREVALAERSLDAEVRKKADAERYALQQKAEAERYRMEQEAAAKRVAMEEEARGIEAKGRAEAEAILAKAEAMKAMGEASVLEMILAALPEMVKNAAEPLGKTDKIVMYGDGNASKLVGDVLHTTSQVTEGLAESTGIDLRTLLTSFLGGRAAAQTVRKDDSAPAGDAAPADPAE